MSRLILNLTQHPATPEQAAMGVFEPSDKARVQDLLTFNGLPTKEEVRERARLLVELTVESGANAAMIGGAPYLMGPLEIALGWEKIQPVYAFSERVSEEQAQPDGTVRKVNVFKHKGFVFGAVPSAMREHGLSSAQGAVPMPEV